MRDAKCHHHFNFTAAAFREVIMKISLLIEKTDCVVKSGSKDKDISGIVYDSRQVGPGNLFVCIVGAKSDGHRYISDVLKKGVSALLIEKGHALPENAAISEDTVILESQDTRKALALLAAAWFGYPSEHMPVIGITGTKGKTTSTYMVKSILENAGYKVGLIGTIESIMGDKKIASERTTPESYVVQEYLHDMIACGCDCAVMEVSSQALKLDRTAGIRFEIGVFTNISPDHIGKDEHKDFAEYMACKGMLFRQCRIGIVNADDRNTEKVIEGHTCSIETYGIDNAEADLRAVGIEHIHKPGYLGVNFKVAGKMDFPVELDIPGKFSVYNALAAISICRHFKISIPDIQKALKEAQVKGRVEMVHVSDDFTLMIDYAHNAMALESLLSTLKDYRPKRLVCVFGCGGNRDRNRRFEMGETSGRMADFTVITSDNPRDEEPQAIIDDIVTGINKTDGKYIEIPDRKEAIAYAIHNGQPGDIIVLAGKGHEDYQEIKGVKHPMDERKIIKEILHDDSLR